MSNSIVKQQKTTNNGFKKGQSGNPNGRPRKPEIEILRKALQSAKELKGRHLIEEAVLQAYTNPTIMVAILKKLLPDKIKGEGFDTKNYTQIFERYTPGDLRELVEAFRSRVSQV